MDKFLLISVVLAATAIPWWAAQDPNPFRGLKKALLYTAAFNVFYMFALRVIWPRIV